MLIRNTPTMEGRGFMYTKTGIVREARQDWAMVETRRQEVCAHCPSKSHCPTAPGGGPVVVRVRNSLHARQGDSVELSMGTKPALRALVLLYGLPVGGIFLGALIGELLSLPLGISQDVTTVLFALTGFVTGLAAIRFYDAHGREKLHFEPVMSRIVARKGSRRPRTEGPQTSCRRPLQEASTRAPTLRRGAPSALKPHDAPCSIGGTSGEP